MFTMMTTNLKLAYNEKDVENLYRQYLTKKFGDILFTSPFGCDGYGESEKHKVRILCEFKDDLDLISRVNQMKVLSQAIYYIKKFEISGKILPSVIFIGDRNECFAIHTNDVFKYLGMDFDWSIPPSKAHTNVELITLMINDENINTYIFSVKDIDDCISKIKEMNDGVVRLVPITPINITEVFKYFEKNILGKTKLTTNEIANLFVQILINPEDNFLHPKKKNTLYTKSYKDIPIKNSKIFESFFKHFKSEYTPKEKEQLTAAVDRIVQDTIRRKQGEFFTPAIWVAKAHEYIESKFGKDWKEKYVVWDPAWGTGNLTRGYKFKELYCSTLNYSDIQTANQMGYNPEATKFPFDFLNDPYEYLPEGLKQAIESGRQIIVLMNPPYGSVNDFNNVSNGGGKSKNKIEDTMIKKQMNEDKFGLSVKNLYSQFMYRIYKMDCDINICLFSPPLFLTGMDFKQFRKFFLNKYEFNGGFLMDSANFADVKSWGLTFSIFKRKN